MQGRAPDYFAIVLAVITACIAIAGAIMTWLLKKEKIKKLKAKTRKEADSTATVTMCVAIALALVACISGFKGAGITVSPVNASQRQYQRGLNALEAKNYEKAIAHFSKAMDLLEKPSVQKREKAYTLEEYRTDNLINRGMSFYRLEQYTEAEQDFTKAIRIAESNPQLLAVDLAANRKADMLKTTSEQTHMTYRETDSESNDTQAYGVAQKYDDAVYYLGNHPEDVAFYKKFYTAYYNRGHVYDCLDQYEKAIDDCEKAMIIDPTQGGPYQLRAWCTFWREAFSRDIKERGDMDDDIKEGILSDFRRAIELEPNNDRHYYNRHRILSRMSDTTEQEDELAISDLLKAIELAPNNAAAAKYYTDLGYFYHWGGTPEDEERSYEAYTKAIELEPKNAEWYVERARQTIHWKLSIFDEEERPSPTFFTEENAMKDYTSAIKLDRKNEDAFKRRAELYSEQAYELKKEEKLEQAEQLYKKAKADYESALKVNKKDSAEAYTRRARLQLDLGGLLPYDDKEGRKSYYEKALAEYTCAIAMDPNDEYLYLGRARQYDSMADLLPYSNKEDRRPYYDMAIDECTKAIAVAPGNTYPYSQRAGYYRSTEEHDKQLADLTKIIELEPDSSFIYTGRARFYEEMKQYEKAIADYTKAIDLEANEDWRLNSLYRDRGKIYEAWGKNEQAIADYTKAIEVAPESTHAYSARADAYYKFGEYEKAIADYTETIRLELEDRSLFSILDIYYSSRVKAYEAIGKYEEAAADYTRIIELQGYALSSDYANRANAYAACGKYEEAVADYTKIIELNDFSYSSDYANRADVYAEWGKTEQAIADYNKAIALGNKESYISLVVLHWETEEYADVVANVDKFIDRGGDVTSDIIRVRGLAYYYLNEFEKAIDDFTEAIKLDSSIARPYLNRAVAYEAIGEIELAKADRESAKELD